MSGGQGGKGGLGRGGQGRLTGALSKAQEIVWQYGGRSMCRETPSTAVKPQHTCNRFQVIGQHSSPAKICSLLSCPCSGAGASACLAKPE